ncbi:MAG: basic secretory family protein, partial [Actinomycetota bacterium]|nr:basic secretory family protein [Actinomycetota bacterium]
LVVVARRARDARALTSDIRGVGSLAAITDSRVRELGPAKRAVEVISQRLLVVWPVFRGADAEARTRVVTHELTHAALAGVTSGRTPGWLVEGIALYVSDDRRTAEAAQALQTAVPAARPSLARLGDPDSIARTSGESQSRAYAYSSAAAHYIAERFGERGLLRFYEAFNDESIRGRPGEPRTTDRVARKTLGIPLRRLERDLRAWTLAGGA